MKEGCRNGSGEYRPSRVAGRLLRWVSDGAAPPRVGAIAHANTPWAGGPEGVLLLSRQLATRPTVKPSCGTRPRPRPARRRPAAGASVWEAGAVVYAVTWWESVPLPVLTFGAVAAHRCTDIAFRANHRERREVEGGNAPWASFGPSWPSSASLSSSLGFSDGLAMRSTSQPNPDRLGLPTSTNG
jgi:hypothetical protein